MIILVFATLSAAWGGFLARRRRGNAFDIAQYAAGFAILGAIVGLVVSIVIARTL